MKKTLLAIALTAAASPSLRIDMTIATGGDRIVSKSSFYVKSGNRGVISSGEDRSGQEASELTAAVMPTLLGDGTVDIQMLFTQRQGKKTNSHASRIVVQLGKLAKFKVGELLVTAKPTLAK